MSATTGVLRRLVPTARELVASVAGDRGWRTLIWALPGALALVYLIALLANFSPVITSINMNGDASIAPVIAKLIGQAPAGSHAVLGNTAYYEEYLFLRLTSGLPFYRQLWDITPFVWTLLGIALFGWSANRALGRFPALLSVSALICLGHVGRLSFFVFDWRGLSTWHTVLIGAALVWLVPRAAEIAWSRLLILAVALGVITALPMSSDRLFPFWALIPMLVTTGLMAWRGRGRMRATLPAFALTTILVSALGGALLAHIMTTSGVTAASFPFTFVVPGNIIRNVELLFEGFISLGGGYFLGMTPSLLGYAVLASGVLILAALAFGLLEVSRMSRRAPPGPGLADPPSPRLAYVAFWSSSLLISSAAFIGTTVPVDTLSSRYLLAGYVAIAALTGLLALRSRGWRIAVTAGVCVFAVSSIYQLVRQPFDPGGPVPGPRDANQLVAFAQANRVRYGYAGYWDAADLTWLTYFKTQLFPVKEGCSPTQLCPVPNAYIDTWYRPRPGQRSMLVVDPTQPGVLQPDPALGNPVAQARIGSLLVDVYPYDIASRFSENPAVR